MTLKMHLTCCLTALTMSSAHAQGVSKSFNNRPEINPSYECYTTGRMNGEPITINFEDRSFMFGSISGQLTANDDYPVVAFVLKDVRHQLFFLDGFESPTKESSRPVLLGMYSSQLNTKKISKEVIAACYRK